MRIDIAPTKQELGRRAAAAGAEIIRSVLGQRGKANIILATGASQFEMLAELVKHAVDWSKVTCFHLDEYVGMPMSHPASFRKYLKERFVDQLATGPAAFHFLNAEGDPKSECRRLGEVIKQHPIDVAFIGIGENGHVAFNDPPADFRTHKPYLVVDLDEACRKQQLGEGWFPSLKAVPKRAISMSPNQIMKSAAIVCTVPDERKARAVRDSLEGEITPDVPASILQRHKNCTLFLDRASASLLHRNGA